MPRVTGAALPVCDGNDEEVIGFDGVEQGERKDPRSADMHVLCDHAPTVRCRDNLRDGAADFLGKALAESATAFFFALLFGFNGSFRHYHVAFHYPHWLSQWLHSPVMHHVQHSYLPQHRDENLAAVTSIRDRMFGTLYVPARDEYTPWGLGPGTQAQYRGFWQNTVGPFEDWLEMMCSGRSPQSGPVVARDA